VLRFLKSDASDFEIGQFREAIRDCSMHPVRVNSSHGFRSLFVDVLAPDRYSNLFAHAPDLIRLRGRAKPDATIAQTANDTSGAARSPRGAEVNTKQKLMKHINLFKLGGATMVAITLACGSIALAQTSVTTTTGGATTATTTTTTAGTISEFSPDTITVRSETAAEPIRYSYTKSTTYVDETGAPVSVDLIKSGLPVTVYYVKQGDRMIANKVVVRKRTTTTTTPGVVEEKKSSTTTTTTK
jgi:hypothetical protein